MLGPPALTSCATEGDEMRQTRFTLMHFALVTLIGACSDDESEADHHADGSESSADHHGSGAAGSADHHSSDGTEISTDAVCPDGSPLTYESFGKSFMDKYCVSCHSSSLVGEAARKGAPEGHDFDRLEGILPSAEHIDQYAAIGPAAENRRMPPMDPKPTDEERTKLGQWLACEESR